MPKSLVVKGFFLPLVTFFVLSTVGAVLFDIPVLRQILGFVFLTFVPGYFILLILKLNKLGWVEKIVLSLGLSVAFSMLFGSALNGSLLALGYAKPISTVPLLTSFSIATIVLAIFAYLRNREVTFSFPSLKLSTREKLLLIVPSLFPLLSIVGMRTMNLTENNILLMLLLFLIPAYVIFVSFYHNNVSQRLYLSLILLISISLVLMLSLRSNHIIGSDIHDEYYLFWATLDNSHWSVLGPSILDACLSISLLPSIYQLFLGINPEYLYKIIYSLLFSVSPLVAYIISKKYIGHYYAFLASFFFMSQVTFLWTTDSARTNIAILFFALAIMVLFHQDINEFAKRFLFIIFAASCIVSHYSTTYVFFFVLLLTWLGTQIMPWVLHREREISAPSESHATGKTPLNSSPRVVMPRGNADTSQHTVIDVAQSQFGRGITVTIVLLFFVLLFFWYSQITIGAFNVGVGFLRQTLVNLNEWFLLETKGTTIPTAVGEGIHTIPQQIRLVFSWLSVAFIAIGVLWTVARYKRLVSTPQSGHIKPDFLCSKFDMEYFILSLTCSAILVITVILPYIAAYSMERVFFQMLAALSPFFVIGGIMVAKWLRASPHCILLLVLIPFFMCTTGTMYQVFGIPTSMALNSAGREYELWYVHDQESYAAKWVNEYSKEGVIYTGAWPGSRVLESQGKILFPQNGGSFTTQYEAGREINGYIYLRNIDIVVNRVVPKYPDIFTGKSKIYTTDSSAVYR